MSSIVKGDKIKKSFSIKSYKSVIIYDFLFIIGFVFLEKYRILFVVLLCLFNTFFLMIENHKVMDIYEEYIVIYENEKEELKILFNQIQSLTKEMGKSGMPSIKILYNDEFDNHEEYYLESPNANEMYNYLMKIRKV